MKKDYKAPKLDNIEFDDIILASGEWQDGGTIVDPDPRDHWGTEYF